MNKQTDARPASAVETVAIGLHRCCCFVDAQGRDAAALTEAELAALPHCDAEATWEVWDGVEPFYDHYWDACDAHLGALMSDAREHHVYRIGAARRSHFELERVT